MPHGGELTIQTRANREGVFVCFFDTGEGMSKETKKKVFEPFFTTKGSKGMGLGMSIAHEIIKRHNGQILIDSELGVGTAVTVQFPLSKKSMKEMENKSHLTQGEKTKVLIMEDNKVTPDVLSENLIN
jgi:signal transduction histidine kinase